MAKLLAVLLTLLVVAEVVISLFIAGVFFWLGTPQTIGAGIAMVLLAAVAGVLTVKFLRSAGGSTREQDFASGYPA